MSMPAVVLGTLTVSGDAVTGPGVATVLIGGRPACVMGDTISGAVMSGAISKGSTTVMIGNRPAARAGDIGSGANVTSGAPMTSPLTPGVPTVLIGG